jgi:hypothetical protein
MNEYRVTLLRDEREEVVTILAETAALAAAACDPETDVIEVKFLRSVGFSCRIRGTGQRR